MGDKGTLDRMEFALCRQSLDSLDRLSLLHGRQRQAGVDARSIDEHGARATSAHVAALFGARQPQASRKASSRVAQASTVTHCCAPLIESSTTIGSWVSVTGRSGGKLLEPNHRTAHPTVPIDALDDEYS